MELALLRDPLETGKDLDRTDWNQTTATLIVKGVHEKDLSVLEAVVDRIEWLLTFAGGALVATSETRIDGSTCLPKQHATWITPARKPFIPPIDLAETNIAQWLHSTYPAFERLEHTYRLRSIIHMLSLADAEHNINIQALLVANTVEILRHSFAENVLVPSARVVLRKGRFYPHLNSRTSMSLEDILGRLARHLRISSWNRAALVEFRNKVIHEGEIPGNTNQRRHDATLEVMQFCHRVILALLEWDKAGGKYVPVTAGRLGPRKFVR